MAYKAIVTSVSVYNGNDYKAITIHYQTGKKRQYFPIFDTVPAWIAEYIETGTETKTEAFRDGIETYYSNGRK